MHDTPYADLGPDRILDAVESLGLASDGRVLALNSYENRVYQVGIEDSEPLIAKFYRPQRWTNEAILEEHQFTFVPDQPYKKGWFGYVDGKPFGMTKDKNQGIPHNIKNSNF